jgi:hypothetical protein
MRNRFLFWMNHNLNLTLFLKDFRNITSKNNLDEKTQI